jgi:hypothetical protein
MIKVRLLKGNVYLMKTEGRNEAVSDLIKAEVNVKESCLMHPSFLKANQA